MPGEAFKDITTLFLFCLIHHHRSKNQLQACEWSGLICLSGCIIHLLLMVLFVCLVFYLVIDFPAELVRFLNFKILNLYCTGIMQYLLLKNMQVMGLHASTFPILQALLFQTFRQPCRLILDAKL